MGRRYMIVKVTLKDIVNNIQFITELSRQMMPARAAYKVGKLLRKLTDEFNDYNSQRQKVVEKYALRDEQGNMVISDGNIQFNSESYSLFEKEFQDLIDTEVEIDTLPIKLYEIENMDFSPGQMSFLESFIEE